MTDKTSTAERDAFEAWMNQQVQAEPEPERTYELDEDGMNQLTKDCMWVAWQARASLPLPGAQEPMFWVRICSDGLYEGPIHNARIEEVRRQSGAWSPLFLAAPHPALSAGCVMVPVEPTEAMKVAAVKYANGPAVYKNVGVEVLRIEEGIYGEVFEAMIAAAPPRSPSPSMDGEPK